MSNRVYIDQVRCKSKTGKEWTEIRISDSYGSYTIPMSEEALGLYDDVTFVMDVVVNYNNDAQVCEFLEYIYQNGVIIDGTFYDGPEITKICEEL